MPYGRLYGFGLAVALTVGLVALMSRSRLGLAIRPTGMDRAAARLAGVRVRHVYAVTFGISAALAGAAGAIVGTVGTFSPADAGRYTPQSFVVTVLGGLGNMWGALAGGSCSAWSRRGAASTCRARSSTRVLVHGVGRRADRASGRPARRRPHRARGRHGGDRRDRHRGGPLLGAVGLQILSEYLRTHFTQAHTLIPGAIIVVAVLLLPEGMVRGLSRSFGGLQAVADVSMTVEAGSVLDVIGPNGAGKSTLLNLVTGQLRPSAGSVLIDGCDLTGARPWMIARAGVARTFQVIRGFRGLTVRENVAVSAMFRSRTSAREAARQADELLERVGLAGKADAAPDELSVAQARRLELARALALRPRLLLLDEVMAGLRHTEIALRCEGVTIVAVEHVLQAILSLADEILVLHEGRELTRGAPAAVVADPRVVKAYLGQRYARRASGIPDA